MHASKNTEKTKETVKETANSKFDLRLHETWNPYYITEGILEKKFTIEKKIGTTTSLYFMWKGRWLLESLEETQLQEKEREKW
jgi:hypothetical protein